MEEETKKKISATMLGVKKSAETRRKMCIAQAGIKCSEEAKIKIRKAKLGTKHTEESKKKMSIASSLRRHTTETRKKISIAHVGKKFSKESREKMSVAKTGMKQSEESKRKKREAAIKYIEVQKLNGLPMQPMFGRNETHILDQVEVDFEIFIERQHLIIGYFLDGYDKQNNVVYEVDEEAHSNPDKKKNDMLRQKNIMNELDCQFVRIKDY
ncbi:hypothetical protein LCGC14_0442210 [marine sediment metagenome]|uniref:Nuclease associated modular domain-containing protein n=1 Tax=marine sediment metagenome TaxID=412755 RepID=A0A0F9V779_9ZZZZ